MRDLLCVSCLLGLFTGVGQAQLRTVTSGTLLEGSATMSGASSPPRSAYGTETSGVPWNAIVETVDLPGVPAQRALAWLSSTVGVTILADWTALAAQGVDPQAPVNLQLHGVTFKQVFELLMQQMQAPWTPYEKQLVYEQEAKHLQILTKGQANQRLVMRTYDILDVASAIPSFRSAPRMDLASALEGGGTQGGGVRFEQQDAEAPVTRDDRAEQVVQMVRDMIEPRVWQQNGGPASAQLFNGRLVVNAPLYVHRQIDRALPAPTIGDPAAGRYVGFSGGNVSVSAPREIRTVPAPSGTSAPSYAPLGSRSIGNIGAVDRVPARPIVGRER